MDAQGMCHDSALMPIGLFVSAVGCIGIVGYLLKVICKKVAIACLMLICGGFAITQLGNYVSHDSALVPVGLVVSTTGCIWMVGYLLCDVWKCITAYACRRK
jgi:hypothetical protein